MELKEAFEAYARLEPEKRTVIHGTSLALRRGGVDTLEQLEALYYREPQRLASMRDIGPRRLLLIRALLERLEQEKHI